MNRTQKIILFSIIGVVVAGLTTAIIVRVVRKRKSGNTNIKNQNPKQILIVGDSKDIFSVAHSPQYDGVFPSNSLLVFTKATELKVNDVLLVRNKALNNLLFIRYRGIDYGSVLTHEKVEIDQYKIEGIMVNMILDNVFLNLPK